MDLKAMAKALGLPESATEAEINAAIEKGNQAQKDLETLKTAQAQKAKDELTAKIKKDVEKAVEEKRITADNSQKWIDALHKDYEGIRNCSTRSKPWKKYHISQVPAPTAPQPKQRTWARPSRNCKKKTRTHWPT